MNKKVMLIGLGLAFVTVCSGLFVSVLAQGKVKKKEITVISREESSGTRGAFDELMKITDGKTNSLFEEAVIVSSTDEVASKVEVDKNAIGYTSIGAITPKVKALTVDGVVAKEENVKNGTYKISRPFVVATRTGASLPVAADFVAFIASKSGQAVVSKAGYIPMDNAPDYKAANLTGKVTLSGSTSVEKVMEKLKEEYHKSNPNVKIEINYNGSSAGIKDCLDSKSDIAMSSRELKPEEKTKLNGTTFALDGIAVIVNKTNEMNAIKSETITKIFKGELRFWNDLTGL
ncbi:MAG: substrate-binding domain-containing protein [Chitinispirillales bacterium]|jgi:phosphate transport system substrate-binding protein|nr:substrate-binding domain-containing protein [Chitinispirillales bacterium]